VGLDGTQFQLINTPQITASFEKARTRRGRAPFAKITTAVLFEIGLDNPLAAIVGRKAVGAHAVRQRAGSQFLLRASRSVKPRVIRRPTDGSRLVVLPVRAPRNPNDA
jgi:hypothetical protein